MVHKSEFRADSAFAIRPAGDRPSGVVVVPVGTVTRLRWCGSKDTYVQSGKLNMTHPAQTDAELAGPPRRGHHVEDWKFPFSDTPSFLSLSHSIRRMIL